jgi:F-type H+-transporting ATPase subunit delta
MKKISAKKYAEALYEMAHDKDSAELKVILKDFVKVLAKHNDLKKEAKVIEYFGKVWAEKEDYLEAIIKTVSKLDDDVIKAIEKYIKETSGAHKIFLKEEIDKSLLGGVVISYGDKVLDGSMRSRLRELRETMEK